jgi:hypothetical protein
MTDIFAQLISEEEKQKKQLARAKSASNSTSKVTSKSTQTREPSREKGREEPRGKSRQSSHQSVQDLPSRDEIQEFSFRLRDELKVKVQAEVPHTWQKELEEIARELEVKRLELYRFILGEFLGKVKRKTNEEAQSV